MEEFFVTFGTRYATEPHPVGEWIHPDGYFVITARDLETARAKTFTYFGTAWAFVYPAPNFQLPNMRMHFPRGELIHPHIEVKHIPAMLCDCPRPALYRAVRHYHCLAAEEYWNTRRPAPTETPFNVLSNFEDAPFNVLGNFEVLHEWNEK